MVVAAVLGPRSRGSGTDRTDAGRRRPRDLCRRRGGQLARGPRVVRAIRAASSPSTPRCRRAARRGPRPDQRARGVPARRASTGPRPGATRSLPRPSMLVGASRRTSTLKQFGRNPRPGHRRCPARRLRESVAPREHRFVDIDSAPAEARRYGVTRPGPSSSNAGSRFRQVERPTEPALATAIVQVTSAVEPGLLRQRRGRARPRRTRAGPGTVRPRGGPDRLELPVDPIALLQGDVPSTCAALVIAGVPTDVQPGELARIDRYLARGGPSRSCSIRRRPPRWPGR